MQVYGAPKLFLIIGIMILHTFNHHLYRLMLFVVCEPLFTGAKKEGYVLPTDHGNQSCILFYLKAGMNFSKRCNS